jgi:hypothetical protein
MHASMPPVVAKLGLTASRISLSGFALFSDRQNETSSAKTAQQLPERAVRKLAGLTSLSTRVLSEIVSAVSFSTSRFSAGTSLKMPLKYCFALLACHVLADMIGSDARSPGANKSEKSQSAAIWPPERQQHAFCRRDGRRWPKTLRRAPGAPQAAL